MERLETFRIDGSMFLSQSDVGRPGGLSYTQAVRDAVLRENSRNPPCTFRLPYLPPAPTLLPGLSNDGSSLLDGVVRVDDDGVLRARIARCDEVRIGYSPDPARVLSRLPRSQRPSRRVARPETRSVHAPGWRFRSSADRGGCRRIADCAACRVGGHATGDIESIP